VICGDNGARTALPDARSLETSDNAGTGLPALGRVELEVNSGWEIESGSASGSASSSQAGGPCAGAILGGFAIVKTETLCRQRRR